MAIVSSGASVAYRLESRNRVHTLNNPCPYRLIVRHRRDERHERLCCTAAQGLCTLAPLNNNCSTSGARGFCISPRHLHIHPLRALPSPERPRRLRNLPPERRYLRLNRLACRLNLLVLLHQGEPVAVEPRDLRPGRRLRSWGPEGGARSVTGTPRATPRQGCARRPVSEPSAGRNEARGGGRPLACCIFRVLLSSSMSRLNSPLCFWALRSSNKQAAEAHGFRSESPLVATRARRRAHRAPG